MSPLLRVSRTAWRVRLLGAVIRNLRRLAHSLARRACIVLSICTNDPAIGTIGITVSPTGANSPNSVFSGKQISPAIPTHNT